MNVYLAKKNGAVVRHTDLAAMEQLDGISVPEMTVTMEEFEAAGGLARVINGEIFLGKTDSEKADEAERDSLTQEEAALRRELAAKDYKVIKAAELGQTLEDFEPGLHALRQQARTRINKIQARLAELETGAAAA